MWCLSHLSLDISEHMDRTCDIRQFCESECATVPERLRHYVTVERRHFKFQIVNKSKQFVIKDQ
jgi:hypothetical protein